MLGSKIETLLAVAEFQNFTKAAASLPYPAGSQPSYQSAGRRTGSHPFYPRKRQFNADPGR